MTTQTAHNSRTLNPKLISQYKQLTEDNAHTDLLLSISKDFKFNSLVQAFTAVKMLHDLEGHITPDIQTLRSHYTDILKATLQISYPLEYAELNNHSIL